MIAITGASGQLGRLVIQSLLKTVPAAGIVAAVRQPAAVAGLAALGVGNVFASFLEGALRNPSAADGQQGRLFIGFAAAELLGLIAFVVAILILFVVK